MSRTPGSRAFVVGAGVFGLSIARELAARGRAVDVVDRNIPGTTGPSSAETRILRCAHGDDEWYARSADRARALWRELESETGERFLLETGVLCLTGTGSDQGWERASLRALTRLGIRVDLVPGAALADRFPGLSGDGIDFAVHEPGAGVLLARRAVRALARSAKDRGVRIHRGEARPDGDCVLIDGERHGADLVVWAPGPGLPALFPGLTSTVVERQRAYYVDPSGPWLRRDQPAWIDRAHDWYGIPAVGENGVKLVPDQEPDGSEVRELPNRTRNLVRARLPDLADATVTAHEECAYAWSPDGHFLLDRLPGTRRTWLVGGDSGHGFKHGPAWGAYVCDVLQGVTDPLPRFRIR
ncbi:NAD(P)/FAD-dependent oxidoreductase [Streptomyces sp. NPDC056405]|uniref:NAD(P)/FAD-dependent oxidoreductase n=1 Tax=Streptomyces sp. NPDC056405 TaxID=3345811 RepID=UPI0035E269B6